MSEPIARARTEHGQVWDDPSIDLLYELMLDIERQDELFVVVERLDATDAFMQVVRLTDGSFLVERRTGSAESHVHAFSSDPQLIHGVLAGWTYDLDAGEVIGWDGTDLDWQPGFGPDAGPAPESD